MNERKNRDHAERHNLVTIWKWTKKEKKKRTAVPQSWFYGSFWLTFRICVAQPFGALKVSTLLSILTYVNKHTFISVCFSISLSISLYLQSTFLIFWYIFNIRFDSAFYFIFDKYSSLKIHFALFLLRFVLLVSIFKVPI